MVSKEASLPEGPHDPDATADVDSATALSSEGPVEEVKSGVSPHALLSMFVFFSIETKVCSLDVATMAECAREGNGVGGVGASLPPDSRVAVIPVEL